MWGEEVWAAVGRVGYQWVVGGQTLFVPPPQRLPRVGFPWGPLRVQTRPHDLILLAQEERRHSAPPAAETAAAPAAAPPEPPEPAPQPEGVYSRVPASLTAGSPRLSQPSSRVSHSRVPASLTAEFPRLSQPGSRVSHSRVPASLTAGFPVTRYSCGYPVTLCPLPG